MAGPTKNRLAFTLIELLVALSLFFILLISSTPSFRHLMLKNKSDLSFIHLKNAFHFVQAEAIFKNKKMILCGSSNNKTCTGDWSRYQLLVDENENIIRHFDFANGGKLSLSGGFGRNDAVVFLPSGLLSTQGRFNWSMKNRHYSLLFLRTGRLRAG